MEATTTVSALTEALVNLLIGGFALVTISWTLTGIQTFFLDRKRDKREAELHEKRMKDVF